MRAAALACGVLLVLCAGAPAATNPSALPGAHVARSLRVVDTAHMHRVSCNCNDIAEEGQAKGSLPGPVRGYVNVGAPIIFRFTITVRGGGTLSGEGSGKPRGNPAEPSFKGTMKVTGGTGRYRHAHGTGGFYGTINRSSYAAVMQVAGTLSY
ncbi:MAG TPA: hypothetical protein VLJ80_08450 [Solirubrobacteraceae bacterium]|nr:hypothetical protein [Solirubrobacteraceae bacterium]